MTSKYPVTMKNGSQIRPIDVFVATLPPNPPADELARMALNGEIIDYGVVSVDCIGRHDGKPATIVYNIFPPDIKWVSERIPGATCVSYGTSTPAAIYAEFMVKGMIKDVGIVAPEIVERSVRDEFIAEMGRRGLVVTRRVERQIN
jgi:saccharopine dehydrogenase-like NADP-dependent oxidoreductase